MFRFLAKNKSLLYYAFALAALLFVMRWLELRLVLIRHAFEIYAGIIAVIFTGLGVWLATRLTKPKTRTVVVEKVVHAQRDFILNETECARRNISKRELEVLGLMAQGFNNAEIAEKLFVSQNTVKSHASKLFEKLEAKRRTQAIENARKVGLLS
jgi:NarL family two-component system response regulator LiaR